MKSKNSKVWFCTGHRERTALALDIAISVEYNVSYQEITDSATLVSLTVTKTGVYSVEFRLYNQTILGFILQVQSGQANATQSRLTKIPCTSDWHSSLGADTLVNTTSAVERASLERSTLMIAGHTQNFQVQIRDDYANVLEKQSYGLYGTYLQILNGHKQPQASYTIEPETMRWSSVLESHRLLCWQAPCLFQ